MCHMYVPANAVDLVIGKGGSEMNRVIAESGATVELWNESPPNDFERVFIIRGTPQQIDHAQHLIRIIIGDVSENCLVHSTLSAQSFIRSAS